MPTPPALSSEQRKQAYQKSLELRRQRARFKQWMGESYYKVGSMQRAFELEIAQGMRVYDLLVSLPGVGHTTAERMLASAGIPVKNTVRACGPRQRERLFAQLDK